MNSTNTVHVGAEVLVREPERLAGRRVGLLTNFTGVLPDLRRDVDALLEAGVQVTALFGPEHGLRGSAQAGESEGSFTDEATGLPVHETYRTTPDELDALLAGAGIDVLLYDMQDVGVRYYTYMWSMFDALASAARVGLPFVVLDRPNPLGGEVVAGPGLVEEYASFVGRIDVPQRHGLTVGEMARHVNTHVLPRTEGTAADLEVIGIEGWRRDLTYEHTGLPWIPPSPNIPTLSTAFAYAGTGLIEGTNLSEGRGTTTPFEVIGAPYVDHRFLPALQQLDLPGLLWRETWVVPTFHKFVGEQVRGAHLHVTDRELFDPVLTAVSLLHTAATLYPEDFGVRVPGEGELAAGRIHAIDRLWGSDSLRLALADGTDPRELLPPLRAAEEAHDPTVLLYS